MSEQFQGLVTVEDQGLVGMVTLRADLSDAAVTGALSAVGVMVPERGQVLDDVLWMSPDELLFAMEYDAAEARAAALASALGDVHSLVLNVSDARAAFRISGSESMVREVLAKLSPADLRASALAKGQVRRTRIAQVPAAFWLDDEGAVLICFQSVRDYVFGLLTNAADVDSAVGFF